MRDKVLHFKKQNDFEKELENGRKNFYKCTFDCEIVIRNKEIKGCCFDKTQFSCKFQLINCKIDSISFFRATFEDEILFENSIFINDTNFCRTAFKSILEVNRCSFKKANFESILFNGRTIFSESIFEKEVSFYGSIFSQYSYFKDSIFKTKTKFDDIISYLLVSFSKSIFLGEISMQRSRIEKDFNFSGIALDVDFSRTIFRQLMVINNLLVVKNLKLISTSFLGILDARDIHVIADETIIQNKLKELGKQDTIRKEDFKISKEAEGQIDLSGSILGSFNLDGHKIQKYANRKSLRVIKNAFLQSGDKIEGLQFHKLEMEYYYNELKSKIKEKGLTFKDWRGYLSELLILFLNKKSNNFGLSWVRGIVFTSIVSVIFLFAFMSLVWIQWEFQPNFITIGDTIKAFLQFINVTNWKYEPFGIEDYNWAYAPLFIGRIFISYGIYQTIQAIRKHGKI